MKYISSQIALAIAAGLTAGSVQAQTTSATATLMETGTSSGENEYSLTLNNTGSTTLDGFWFAWTFENGDDLAATPTAIGAPSGWSFSPSGPSIQFTDSGTPVAVGGSATFTFEAPSTVTPVELTTPPSGNSVAYSDLPVSGFFAEGNNGASPAFSTTLVATPEPSTLGMVAMGACGLLAGGWRKLRR